VTVRFLNGLTKLISVKDLETTQDKEKYYSVGQVVCVAQNKKGRFSLKSTVVNKADTTNHTSSLKTQVEAFDKLFKAGTEKCSVKIGEKVTATVQLVKDYGLILAIKDHDDVTGFIINEQKASGKQYKVGSEIECVVLDIDTSKMIVDLSERLLTTKKKEKAASSSQKAFVELNKEQYLVITLKN